MRIAFNQLNLKSVHQLGKDDKFIGRMKECKIIFDEGRYLTRPMLVMGFLNCNHVNQKEQYDDLWALINPEIEENITF